MIPSFQGNDAYFLQIMCTGEGTQKKRKRFTPEEDQKLKEMVLRYGLNWTIILPEFPDKTKRQLNDRWFYYLDPGLKAAPFTNQEDILLETKLSDLGPKWRKIARFFPGRTDIALKNRWKMIQRHRMDENSKYQRRKKISPHSSSPAVILQPCKKEKNEECIQKSEEIFDQSSFDVSDAYEFDFCLE